MDELLAASTYFDYFVEFKNSDQNNEFPQDAYGLDIFKSELFKKDLFDSFQWLKVNFDSSILFEAMKKLIAENISNFFMNESQDSNEFESDQIVQMSAFVITTFCVDQSYQSRGEDLLRFAFEEHEDLNYCLYMLPCSCSPTILTNCMTRVVLKHGVSIDQSLYLIHRDALSAPENFEVVRLDQSMLPTIDKFITSHITINNEILSNCHKSLVDNDVDLKDNPNEVSFVAKIGDDIVGIVNLTRKYSRSEDISWLRSHYSLDDFINFSMYRSRAHATILDWVIIPTFSKWSRYFFREIMRSYCKSILYFPLNPSTPPSQETFEILFPCRTRRVVQSNSATESGSFEDFLDSSQSLFFITKRLLIQPRTTITSRLLVVAGSCSSFLFLENIIFANQMYIPNITIVIKSPPSSILIGDSNNLNASSRYADDLSGCLSLSDCEDPTENELLSFGFSHRLTVVKGQLTDIDRINRYNFYDCNCCFL